MPTTIPVPDFRTYGFGHGNVEVDAFNPCGLIDGRFPVTPVAGATPDLQWGILRLGLDGPCGTPYDFYRVFFRFPLDGTDGGPPNLPATAGQALFIFYWRPDIAELIYPGSQPTRLPVCQAVDLTGPFPSGAAGAPGTSLPEADPPVAIDYGSTGTFDAASGKVTVDVTTAYDLARSLGRADLWLMLRFADESNDGLTGGRWYGLIATESVNVETRPRLELSTPAPQTVRLTPLSLALVWLEPCVAVTGEQLAHRRTRGDAAPGTLGLTLVRRGNVLVVEVRVEDAWTWPPRAVDPPGGVAVTLRAQDGTVVLADAPGVRVDVGHYTVRYRTQVTDPLGPYSAQVAFTP